MKITGRFAATLAVLAGVVCGTALLAPAAEVPYRIGEGDVLEVIIWKKPELSRKAIVLPDGMITLPLIREVKAAGLTAAELRQTITEQLNAYLNAPDVSVSVEEPRSYRAFVLGGAVTNGSFNLQRPLNAGQLLAQAGGPKADADLSAAYIMRGDQKIPVNLSLGAGAAPGANPVIMAGDTLTVPFLQPYALRILVIGEVLTPKAIPFKDSMTVLDALLEAGGGTAFADTSSISIYRQSDTSGKGAIRVDLKAIIKGNQTGNIQLNPGDIVTVPPAEGYAHRILVLGQVKTPRSIPYRAGMTVLDAYAEAGGGTEWADEGSVKVVRRAGEAGKQEIPVNLKRIMSSGDLALNISLSPGDIIFVPR